MHWLATRLFVVLALAALAGCTPLPPLGTRVPGPAETLSIRDRHECDRCHLGEAVFGPRVEAGGRLVEPGEPSPGAVEWAAAPAPLLTESRSCAGCHQSFSTAREDPAHLARGREVFGERFDRYVEGTATRFCAVPSLSSMERFRARWLKDYLEAPFDLRPNLVESMIRHNLSPAEADALVLGWNGAPELPEPRPPSPEQLARGAALFEHKSCGLCHLFGARRFEVAEGWQFEALPKVRLRALAPDLRHARDRLNRSTIVRWVVNPASVKPTAAMPRLRVSAEEAEALADFIFFADLGAPRKPTSRRPPPVAPGAPVPDFADVYAQVFEPVCRHCHGNPLLAAGDRGPGDTGGFGFPGLGLSFASCEDVTRGSLGPGGQRRSVFRAGVSGEPVILERLRARFAENERDYLLPGEVPAAGHLAPAGVPKGMPLGLPALEAGQLALVEQWVRGGHSCAQ